jgi:succinyl-CoA synthetase beta subunit
VIERGDIVDQLEINPLWIGASGDTVVALDALVVQRIQDA